MTGMGNVEELDPDWPVWFMVIDDAADDGLELEPAMPSYATQFIFRLRQRIPTWRALGLDEDDTGAAYADGRVWISISLVDQQDGLALGDIRVDLSAEGWTGSWTTGPWLATELANAGPTEQHERSVDDPEVAVGEATDWLEQQLRRPISRRIWHRDGDIAASLWQLDDTGRAIVLGGDPALRQDPDSADEITRVRG